MNNKINNDRNSNNIINKYQTQMKKTIDIQQLQSQNEQNQIYNLLPQARPLHIKTIPQKKSLFAFTADPAPMDNFQQQNSQECVNVLENNNASMHAVGASLCQLFKNPVYQSYAQLQLGQDNAKFATCTVRLQNQQSLKPVYLNFEDESLLVFQSRFQSGNLAVASRSPQDPNQYNLAIQRDTNSRATCQWYYFSVENRKNVGVYTFNIVNLVKNYSAYENGMQPCVFSSLGNAYWKRDGFDIYYKKNSILYRGQRTYYSLKFSYKFQHKNDKVFFAYSYPYTFTKLQKILLQIQNNYSNLAQVKILTKTLIGNPVNMISITNPHKNLSNSKQNKKPNKQMLLISARVHPGETNSSFACEGLIKYLLGSSQQVNNLRQHYIIKIIPFLNPDGVIHGNYRTSLSGHDLNRKWKRPDKQLHPQIYALKKYLSQTHYRKALYIDLHGHSKKKSSFMYGCLNKQNPYLCKQLPFILSKLGHHFCYFNCNFTTPSCREGTSRMNLWKQFGVDYSYTLQISFFGPVRSRQQFTIKDYLHIGSSLGKVVANYFCGKKSVSGPNNQIGNFLKQLYSQQQLLNQGIQESEGSQSGQQQALIIPDKKQQKPNTSNKQSDKELKGILTRYLHETKLKWNRQIYTKSNLDGKKQQKSSPNLRTHRKQLAPSRISIQKIDLSEQISSPYINVTFMRGNIRVANKQLRPNKQITKISNNRCNYGPYSYSKGKLNSKNNIQQQTLMLPKVLREEQLKYRKYRKRQCKFQISLSHQQTAGRQNSRANSFANKEISLAQKIFQSTHKQLQETGRYWVRNS